MKGKIFYEGKEFHFPNLRSLTIQAGGKSWVFEGFTESQLRFKPAAMGGYGGTGNWLKAWRKRNKQTQTEAAKIFGVSQSLIAKIEKNERAMPEKIFRGIQANVRTYGRE